MKLLIILSVLLGMVVSVWSQELKSITVRNAKGGILSPDDDRLNQGKLPIDNRYAFLIGIDNYEDKTITPLNSCRNDALTVQMMLASPRMGGLDLTKMKHLLEAEATKENVMESLVSFLNRIDKPEDATLYFYFSGHGESEGLVLKNSVNGQPQTYLTYSWLLETLKAYRFGMVIIIIDACQSGSILATAGLDKGSQEFVSDFEEFFRREGRGNFVVFAATRPEAAAKGGPTTADVSLYTKYFYKGIMDTLADADSNGIITTGELANYLKIELINKNPPEFSGLKDFPFANLRVEPSAGIWDYDRDGIRNDLDKCPNESGLLEFSGCPTIPLEINQFIDERDGEIYSYAELNGLKWMREDLRYAAAGSLVNGHTGKSRYYSSDHVSHYVVNEGICPKGWKIPSEENILSLIEYFTEEVNFNDTSFTYEAISTFDSSDVVILNLSKEGGRYWESLESSNYHYFSHTNKGNPDFGGRTTLYGDFWTSYNEILDDGVYFFELRIDENWEAEEKLLRFSLTPSWSSWLPRPSLYVQYLRCRCVKDD